MLPDQLSVVQTSIEEAYNDPMSVELPAPPASVLECRALEDRYGQLADWVEEATRAAYRDRALGHQTAMRIENLSTRWAVFRQAESRYWSRLQEIDDTEEAFKKAYESVRKSLDSLEIIEYGLLVSSFGEDRRRAEAKERARKQLQAAFDKADQAETRRKKQKAKAERKAGVGRMSAKENNGRDRDIPQADRTQTASDEGAGGGAIAEDRGLHDAPGRIEGGSLPGGEGQGPPPDDRVELEIGRIDREGPTESGL